MRQVRFSFEVPIKHLEDFEDLQDFHFSLSFLYENKDYKKFMMSQARKGLKPLWLDNSYNEKLCADESDSLIALAKEVDAAKVICPDCPDWPESKIFEAFNKMNKELPSYKLIVVASSGKIPLAGEVFGASHYAYSYWNRQQVPIIDRGWANNYHFLGMLTIAELVRLNPPSCDTSMPIKMALRGWNVDKWEEEGSPHIYTHEMGIHGSDFFNLRMSDTELLLARSNIEEIKRRVNGIR